MTTALLLFLSLAAGTLAMNLSDTASLILVNGNIHTMDPALPRAQAVAVSGDRIIYVGDSPGALKLKGASTQVMDLGGQTVVPGLIDAHGHVSSLGFALERLDLVGTTSGEEIARMVARKAATLKPGRWIRGRGWDQNDWEVKFFPTREILDRASPDNPVMLDRIDGHAIWVNSRAMERGGVTRATLDPPGGRILRDGTGQPTGVFVDEAEELIASKVPPPSKDEIRTALMAGMKKCLEGGLTGVHDAGVSPVELEVYRELLVTGDFPFRIYAMLSDDPALLESWFETGPQVGLGGHRLTVRAVKMYIDGALGSRGAALLAPYQDDQDNTGLLRMDPPRMRELVERAARAGFQVNVHAIGDRGNRLALDSLEAGTKVAPSRDFRFRVEHAQVLAPEEIPRFGSLRVIASMQPTHATSDMYWAGDRLGPQRVKGAYVWRSLLASGARLACGSDFPVESEKPLLGFYAAVTRQDPKGWPAGGWFPDQILSREEALKCFTLDAAYAAFEENLRGSIRAGKLADMTVLTRDIMAVPAAEILNTSVGMTVLGGKVAYQKR